MTLDFIFRLVLCSRDDVSFNIICLNVLEDIKQFYLLIRFKKKRLETLFKCDNVKALIKMSNCENLVLYFSVKVQKIAAFAMLFWFSVTKQSLENGWRLQHLQTTNKNDEKLPSMQRVKMEDSIFKHKNERVNPYLFIHIWNMCF